MNSDIPLDCAVFQLSPRRSRCELFVSCDGTHEKLASGLVKPFVTHLKAVEGLVASDVQSIKLEAKRCRNSESWFTKGTLERFVQFVSTPEVLEMVIRLDAEMSQLEAARKIYSQGPGAESGSDGGGTIASDATKKELIRAIDVRLVAVGQDLTSAFSHASTAGFSLDTVLELQLFADQFGAHRLSESCSIFMSLCQRRPELFRTQINRLNDQAVRSSYGSDMSLDDQANDSRSGSLLNQHQPSQSEKPDELKSATLQPASKPSTICSLRRSTSRESSMEKEDMKGNSDRNKEIKEDTSFTIVDSEPPSPEVGLRARRLSVQDRISLFENKKQENSSGSGSKPAVGKSVDLRRLSSDASSAGQMGSEKAVMRRWSGASDMSIDSGGERKDIDSSVGTPIGLAQTTISATSIVSEDMDRSNLHNSATLLKPETKGFDASQVGHNRLENQSELEKEESESQPFKTKLGAQQATLSGASQEDCHIKSSSFSGRSESVLNDQRNVGKQSNAWSPEDFAFENQVTSPALPRRMEQFASRAQTSCEEKAIMSSGAEECAALREDCVAQKAQLGILPSRSGYDLSDSKTYQDAGEPEAIESKSMFVQRKGSKVAEKTARKEYESAEQQPENPSVQLEDSGAHKMMFQRHGSASAQAKKSKGRRDHNGSGLVMPRFSGRTVSNTEESEETFSSIMKTPTEQAQRVKQSKGNQELHDELKLKADELDKLFAEHKLRLPGNQSSVTRKGKFPQEQELSLVSRDATEEASTPQVPSRKMVQKPSHASPLIQPLENQDFDTPKHNIYNLGSSGDSRGKLYDQYMQKREEKLKEEWSSKGAEKEARIKVMEDSFEKSRSEMKTKFAGSADRQDSHQRAEKLRSFSARSAVRRDQPIYSFVSDEDEEQTEYGGASRSAQSKKALLNNNAVSSTPRTAGAPAPRSSVKASASSAGRRKPQPENTLAQSVPNFSDLRKENTKPSTVISEGTGRSQVRNYPRSKNSSGDVLSYEEKSRRPHHTRKSSANPLELKDLASLNFEDVEHKDELPRRAEVGSFLRKGNTSSIPRSKASFTAKTLVNENEELMNTTNGEDLESEVDDDYGCMDEGNPRGSQGSVKSTNSGCENGDAMRVPSEAGPTLMAEMPAVMPSAFRSMASVLDSPGESPGSWHSRINNPFSFQHEISDLDASVDSPIGSPEYLNANDPDAGRMRKKWGAAQRPIVDSSHGQSRKDVTKGLKRFLNFGRKNRGPDSLADWVSITTSEGDDDMEDAKDAAKWSSEDLRKSRMGLSHFHPDDGFSEINSNGDEVRGTPSSIPTPPRNFRLREDHLSGSALKAPKSFFSLSTFRGKGSDSKPR